MSDLLNADTVVPYLVERGVLRSARAASATTLGGGAESSALWQEARERFAVLLKRAPLEVPA